MKILDMEINFNFNDAEDLEKLENALDKAQEKLQKVEQEGKRTSVVIREICNIVFDCFNKVFGEESNKDIFGNVTNMEACIKAFKELKEAREEQDSILNKEIEEIAKQYSPNRAQRCKK
ncbi:MAG: DUF6673 family protein [Bacilli bacterium]